MHAFSLLDLAPDYMWLATGGKTGCKWKEQETWKDLKLNWTCFDIHCQNVKELCDEVSYYIVEIETEEDGDKLLVFEMTGNYVNTANQIHNDDLPTTVLDGIDTAYPNKKLSGNYSWQIGDQYLLKLKGNLRIVMDADGNVLCEL